MSVPSDGTAGAGGGGGGDAWRGRAAVVEADVGAVAGGVATVAQCRQRIGTASRTAQERHATRQQVMVDGVPRASNYNVRDVIADDGVPARRALVADRQVERTADHDVVGDR